MQECCHNQFGATQLAVAGGFTTLVPWEEVGLSLAWFAGFAGLALLIFWWRTHARNVSVARSFVKDKATFTPDPEPSAVHVQQD